MHPRAPFLDLRPQIRYAPGVNPREFGDTGIRVVTAPWLPPGKVLLMQASTIKEASRRGYALTPYDL